MKQNLPRFPKTLIALVYMNQQYDRLIQSIHEVRPDLLVKDSYEFQFLSACSYTLFTK